MAADDADEKKPEVDPWADILSESLDDSENLASGDGLGEVDDASAFDFLDGDEDLAAGDLAADALPAADLTAAEFAADDLAADDLAAAELAGDDLSVERFATESAADAPPLSVFAPEESAVGEPSPSTIEIGTGLSGIRLDEAEAAEEEAFAQAAAAGEHDEPREVLIRRAEPVGDPGPGGGQAGILAAGVHQELGRPVVELVGHHRLDEAEPVGLRRQLRQPVGKPLPAFAMSGEGIDRPEQPRHALDEGEPFALEERGRRLLPVEPGQFRLVVEEFELARRPGHVEVDHIPHLRGEVRLPRGQRPRRIDHQRLGGSPPLLPGQPQAAEQSRATGEKLPPGVQ
jgi:hypothetical protein